MLVSLEVQVTNVVTSIVDPSSKVPVAVNGRVAPAASDGLAGRIAIAVRLADDTTTVALPATAPSWAVIAAVPRATAAASPLLAAASPTVTAAVLPEVQVATRVTSRL